MKLLGAYIDASLLASKDLIKRGLDLQNMGIDTIVVTDFTSDEAQREAFLDNARALSRAIDIPFIIGTGVKRFEDTKKAFYTGAVGVILQKKEVDGTNLVKESTDRFGEDKIYVMDGNECTNLKGDVILITGPQFDDRDDVSVYAIADKILSGTDIMSFKRELKNKGIDVNTFTTDVTFDSLKKDAIGLVPCIVQDYKTSEVLMMAYMDEEAFKKTVTTGVMTYHSRSRNELWIKGATSGHYQYLRELSLDCDNDTLLAKVVQIGAACHTGNRSCFFNTLIKHEYEEKDISKVLSSLYDVVVDRKNNPKEGSYTNYLFNKGIDKILKKCGEEATEMVIAAKNPNAEELKYEIADLLYHMTVLMVECGVDWSDVAAELANR